LNAASAATCGQRVYWSDLIGLKRLTRRCRTRHREQFDGIRRARPAGRQGDREYLIPFVAAFVGKVDVAGGQIEVDWGEDY